MARSQGFRNTQAKVALDHIKGLAPSFLNNRVAESARKILDRQGWTQSDVDAVVNFNGGFSSFRGTRASSSSISRAQQSFAQQAQRFQNYGTAAALLGNSQTSGLGKASLSLQIAKDVESALKTRLARSTAVAVGKYLGENPGAARMFLRYLGAGLRIGGAFASVAILGAEVYNRFSEVRRERAEAQLQTYKAKRAAGVNPALTADAEKAIDVAVYGGAGFGDKFKSDFGMSSELQKQAEAQKQAYFKAISEAREKGSRVGIDEAAVLAAGADKMGKGIGDLSEEEKRSIIDEAFIDKYGIRAKKYERTDTNDSRASVGRSYKETGYVVSSRYLNDDQVLKRLEAGGYQPGTREYNAKQIEYALERATEVLQTKLKKVADSEARAAEIRFRRSGVDTWRHNEMLRKGSAEFASYKLRQRPYVAN